MGNDVVQVTDSCELLLEFDTFNDTFEVTFSVPKGISETELADCLVSIADDIYRRRAH